MKRCHRCGGPGERSEHYDAYLCGRCGLWLEGACGDPKCSFCNERPPTPPTVMEPVTLPKMSPAARLEMLRDLYAPMVMNEGTGQMERDPKYGVISKEDFVRLLDISIPDSTSAPKDE